MCMFYVADNMDQGWVTVCRCPTKKMVSDFFAKSMQGFLFHKLCARILNCLEDPESELLTASKATATGLPLLWPVWRPEECAGYPTGVP